MVPWGRVPTRTQYSIMLVAAATASVGDEAGAAEALVTWSSPSF